MDVSTYYLGLIEFIILIVLIFLPYFGLHMGLKKFYKHMDKSWYLKSPTERIRYKNLQYTKIWISCISVFVLTFFGVLPFIMFVVL